MKNILSVPALEFLVLSGHAGYNLDIDVTKGPLVSVAKTDFYEIVKAVYANGGDEVVNGLIKYTPSKEMAFQLEFVKSFYGVKNDSVKDSIERIPYYKNTWLTGTEGRVLVDRDVLYKTLKALRKELLKTNLDIDHVVPGSKKVFSVLDKDFKELFKREAGVLSTGERLLEKEKHSKLRVRKFFNEYKGTNLVLKTLLILHKFKKPFSEEYFNAVITGKNEAKRLIYIKAKGERIGLTFKELNEASNIENINWENFVENFNSFI